jgi:NADPH2:quinone reductase
MRAPVEFGNAAVNTSLPVGWGQLAQKLRVRVDERKAAMRAIQIARLDGPQAAEVVEIAEPSGDGEVIIDVHAAGVAFPDALQSRGLYQYKPEMPYTPGAEVAAGDRVCGLTMLYRAMAEVVALQPDRLIKLLDSLS